MTMTICNMSFEELALAWFASWVDSWGLVVGKQKLRWAHVCPKSEFLVPGSMKGINSQMEDGLPTVQG